MRFIENALDDVVGEEGEFGLHGLPLFKHEGHNGHEGKGKGLKISCPLILANLREWGWTCRVREILVIDDFVRTDVSVRAIRTKPAKADLFLENQ